MTNSTAQETEIGGISPFTNVSQLLAVEIGFEAVPLQRTYVGHSVISLHHLI